MAAKTYAPHRERRGSDYSRGSELLAQTVARKRLSLQAAAIALGCTKALLSRWALGDGRPGLEWALKIRDAFRIPVDAWVQSPLDALRAEESGHTLPEEAPASRKAAS